MNMRLPKKTFTCSKSTIKTLGKGLKNVQSFFFCFLSGFFSKTLTIHRLVRIGRESYIYSPVPLPPAQEHLEIYLQLCKWNDYNVILIALYVITRLLIEETYHQSEFKVNKKKKTPKRLHCSHSGVVIVSFQGISYLFIVFLLSTFSS